MSSSEDSASRITLRRILEFFESLKDVPAGGLTTISLAQAINLATFSTEPIAVDLA